MPSRDTIDVATARQIRDLFGPRTAVYELLTPEEISEQVSKIGSLRKWIVLTFDCEEIDLEEMGDAVGSWNWWRGVRKRVESGLKELGL
jgi:hypothetical protein